MILTNRFLMEDEEDQKEEIKNCNAFLTRFYKDFKDL